MRASEVQCARCHNLGFISLDVQTVGRRGIQGAEDASNLDLRRTVSMPAIGQYQELPVKFAPPKGQVGLCHSKLATESPVKMRIRRAASSDAVNPSVGLQRCRHDGEHDSDKLLSSECRIERAGNHACVKVMLTVSRGAWDGDGRPFTLAVAAAAGVPPALVTMHSSTVVTSPTKTAAGMSAGGGVPLDTSLPNRYPYVYANFFLWIYSCLCLYFMIVLLRHATMQYVCMHTCMYVYIHVCMYA